MVQMDRFQKLVRASTLALMTIASPTFADDAPQQETLMQNGATTDVPSDNSVIFPNTCLDFEYDEGLGVDLTPQQMRRQAQAGYEVEVDVLGAVGDNSGIAGDGLMSYGLFTSFRNNSIEAEQQNVSIGVVVDRKGLEAARYDDLETHIAEQDKVLAFIERVTDQLINGIDADEERRRERIPGLAETHGANLTGIFIVELPDYDKLSDNLIAAQERGNSDAIEKAENAITSSYYLNENAEYEPLELYNVIISANDFHPRKLDFWQKDPKSRSEAAQELRSLREFIAETYTSGMHTSTHAESLVFKEGELTAEDIARGPQSCPTNQFVDGSFQEGDMVATHGSSDGGKNAAAADFDL